MKLDEFIGIENKTDEEIKQAFNFLLWEAIESAFDIPENLPTEIDGECCNKAALHWQKEIQTQINTIVENAIFDYRENAITKTEQFPSA